MDDKILDAHHGVKGGFAAAQRSTPLTPWLRPNKSIHAIQTELSIALGPSKHSYHPEAVLISQRVLRWITNFGSGARHGAPAEAE